MSHYLKNKILTGKPAEGGTENPGSFFIGHAMTKINIVIKAVLSELWTVFS